MRTIKELYELLLEQIKEMKIICSGLCIECREMRIQGLISKDEEDILQRNIERDRPRKKQSAYGWSLNEQGTEERKQFLQLRIKELTHG